jgi:hypothetical protein
MLSVIVKMQHTPKAFCHCTCIHQKSTTIHTGIIDGNAIKEMAKIVLSIEILPRDTMAAFWDFCPKSI